MVVRIRENMSENKRVTWNIRRPGRRSPKYERNLGLDLGLLALKMEGGS